MNKPILALMMAFVLTGRVAAAPAKTGARGVVDALTATLDSVAAHDQAAFLQHVDLTHFVSRFIDDLISYGFVSYPDDTAAESAMKFMAAGMLRLSAPAVKQKAEQMILTEIASGGRLRPADLAECRAVILDLRRGTSRLARIVMEKDGTAQLEGALRLRDQEGEFVCTARVRFIRREGRWLAWEAANLQEIFTDLRTRRLILSQINENILGIKVEVGVTPTTAAP